MHSRFVGSVVVVASAVWMLTTMHEVGLADWPQWRGPQRDDVSTEAGLLKSWPEGGPRRVWLFEDGGLGYAGPAIVGNRLFIMGARDGTEYLLAIDVESGREQWAAPIGELYENDWGGGPRGTPTVDGQLVYALGGQGTLIGARVDNGDVVWSKAMQDLGGATPNWGYCESPLVVEDNVICTPGGEQGSLAALNKETGEVVWQSSDLTSGAHYSSIVLMPHDGHTDLVQLLPDQLVGVNAQTGKSLWTVPWPKPVAAIPTPIVRDQFVYCTSAYGTGCMLVEVGADHAAQKAYENKVMKNKHGGVILVGDHVFGHSDGVGWVRQDFKTGEQLWRERDAMEAGAVAYADGMFYCLGEDTGDVALVEPSAEGWKENGRFKLEPQSDQRSERGKIWTHPVICDGRLYLRDQNLVYCYDVRAGAEQSGGGE